MRFLSQDWMLSWAILVLVLVSCTPCLSATNRNTKNNVKSAVFMSPKIELSPGSISNKFYYDVEFPRGHIALKSFNAELVDESGNSVPLQETYLHHWIVLKYQQPKNVTNNNQTDIIMVRNNGLCQDDILGQYYGLGAETRGTDTYIPDPYGVEIGNPSQIPKGYDEKWMINVHAIDTRGVEDIMGCIECKCDLYNVTINALTGKPLSPNYKGGLGCCPDNGQCRLRKGFLGTKHVLYLKYTIMWVDWDDFVVPVKIYLLDVTDDLKISYNPNGMSIKHNCKVEYQVKPCTKSHVNGSGCVNIKRTSVPIKTGGYIIYSAGHQHVGAIRSTLYGQV
ncbi:stress up-regulated Nod 19 protein [Medicago truncatula]|uniref:Stress up-regulated Nod 19 protein n=1 Tax=Medicago truncatula TaxID=3880 RepID=A0A072VFW1_MEDTR|nr:stress up-regulated Nod 19 protein [Medicago truncatula]